MKKITSKNIKINFLRITWSRIYGHSFNQATFLWNYVLFWCVLMTTFSKGISKKIAFSNYVIDVQTQKIVNSWETPEVIFNK